MGRICRSARVNSSSILLLLAQDTYFDARPRFSARARMRSLMPGRCVNTRVSSMTAPEPVPDLPVPALPVHLRVADRSHLASLQGVDGDVLEHGDRDADSPHDHPPVPVNYRGVRPEPRQDILPVVLENEGILSVK